MALVAERSHEREVEVVGLRADLARAWTERTEAYEASDAARAEVAALTQRVRTAEDTAADLLAEHSTSRPCLMAHIDHVDGEQRRRLDAAQETIDTLRGECGDDGHAPWCREWRALVVAERDALRVAMADLGRQTIEEAEERGALWMREAAVDAYDCGPLWLDETPHNRQARRSREDTVAGLSPATVCRTARKEGTR
jgi:hypothetical protein